jgi:hypothetical protein
MDFAIHYMLEAAAVQVQKKGGLAAPDLSALTASTVGRRAART